ncbi:MAG TPA: hypothetical protein VHN14_21470 [Kofleriaceae bacterium]|nr:hypothetical protein [Kofleriaceae bacterium]
MRRSRISLVFVVAAFLLLPSSMAAAQAWVNAKGELSLTLRSDYQTSQGVWHGPTLVTGLPAQSLNNAFSAEYIPIDKLSLGLTLNGNGVRYTGPLMNPGDPTVILAHGTQDDGAFHWNVTDLDLDAHYQLYDGAITLTPLIHFRTPVTSYEQKGYAASGTHLREGSLGLYLGKYGLGLDDLVIQLGYTFTYVQKETGGGAATEQYRTNRSDADLSVSYVITEKFIAGVGAAFRYTHDGFDLADYPALLQMDPNSTLQFWHDPVLRAKYLAPTAFASYQISPAWSLAARFAAIVWGENVSNPISFGISLGWANNLVD